MKIPTILAILSLAACELPAEYPTDSPELVTGIPVVCDPIDVNAALEGYIAPTTAYPGIVWYR